MFLDNVKQQVELLEEIKNDTEIEIEYSKDSEAKVGHKTAYTAFFGYKTHIAETPERAITAATITTGEKHDGKQLINLIEDSNRNGINVKAIIGDGAYSEEDNLNYCSDNNIKNVSKLSKIVLYGNSQRNSNFEFNKDAGMYVKMAIWLLKRGNKSDNYTEVIVIFLILKNVNIVIIKRMFIYNIWSICKLKSLKSCILRDIKSKLKMQS